MTSYNSALDAPKIDLQNAHALTMSVLPLFRIESISEQSCYLSSLLSFVDTLDFWLHIVPVVQIVYRGHYIENMR